MSKRDSDDTAGDVPLAEMIQTLRVELQRAAEASADADILFEVEKVELELQVAVSRSAKGHGGVEFWLVKGGGEYEKSGTATHTFKISLTPEQDETGKRVKVAKKTTEPLAQG